MLFLTFLQNLFIENGNYVNLTPVTWLFFVPNTRKKIIFIDKTKQHKQSFRFFRKKLRAKEKFAVSGNAGDEKNLHGGSQKKIFYQFN